MVSQYTYFCILRKWVERLCKLTERYGPDYWWELSIEKLIGRELRQELTHNVDDLEKGTVRMTISILVSISHE